MTLADMATFLHSKLPPVIRGFVSPHTLAKYPYEQHGSNELNQDQTELVDPTSVLDLSDVKIQNASMGEACRSGLWLLVGRLETAHRICQELDLPEGSWWHAIVHRIEGDYWNSRYWYRHVGLHPAWSTAADWAVQCGLTTLSKPDSIVSLAEQGGCEATQIDEYQAWSLCEWAGLFCYCFDQAKR